jgi:phosphatidylglycerol:prolipoprotein diacylglycerol transferase
MYPVLFSIGPVSFYSYGILVSIGFFVSVIVLVRIVEKSLLNLQFLADHFFAFLFVPILGARLFYVVLFWEDFSYDFLSVFYIWQGGFSLWGGIVTFLILFSFYAKKAQEDFLQWLNVFLPPAILWAFFESVAAFLDGKDFGTQTTLPWGVQFDNPMMPFAGVSVHPAQLYAAAFFLLFFLLLRVRWSDVKNIPRGFGYFGVIVYALFQFLLDFFHGDFVPYFFGIRATQVIALSVVIFFSVLYFRERSKRISS